MNKFTQAILTSADSIKQLRGCDVYRVLDENGHVDGLAAWIKAKRPDLVSQVDMALVDIAS